MNEKTRLRILDFGFVAPLRSQAVYHGVAHTIGPDDDPVLTLLNPNAPYVCIGIHQEVAKEVDEGFCLDHDLPIIRRHVGGGAVYLDRNQMFFHFIYPRLKAPQFARTLYPRFIEPVLRTYRALGIAAEYRPINDIQVHGRKIGGTGAASIGEATVMVGSFVFDFDTAMMAKCLRVPSEKFRDKLKSTLDDYMTTMTRELATVPARERVKALFLHHCAEALGARPLADRPSAAELAAIAGSEHRLADPAWTHREGRMVDDAGVKISEGLRLAQGMHKAPGGLIRTNVLVRDGAIEDLVLSGDFTCLPEDGVVRLCARLAGTALARGALERAATVGLRELSIDMPGVSSADIATAILSAVAPQPWPDAHHRHR